MTDWKLYPITYMGVDKKRWIKEQLVLKYRNEKAASTFLDLRNIYQSKRDQDWDLKHCKSKPRYDKIVELGNVEY